MASIYRPLDSSKDEVRLLRILPRRSSVGGPRSTERIQCVLRHAPLGEAKYDALSYTWLDDDLDISECEEADLKGDGVEILLDGQRVTVTHNLWLALAHFRENAENIFVHETVDIGLDEDCWFWIDAICINQSDLDERNSQVLRMRAIYQRAETVRVWLGIDSQYPGLAIELSWKLEYAMQNNASARDVKTDLKTWVLRALEDLDLDSHWRADVDVQMALSVATMDHPRAAQQREDMCSYWPRYRADQEFLPHRLRYSINLSKCLKQRDT